MLTVKEEQQKLFNDTNKKLQESFYRHSNDYELNVENLKKLNNILDKPFLQTTYRYTVTETKVKRTGFSSWFNKKPLYLYRVYRQDNPTKIVKTFTCIKQAYILANKLNETDMLVVKYKMD